MYIQIERIVLKPVSVSAANNTAVQNPSHGFIPLQITNIIARQTVSIILPTQV